MTVDIYTVYNAYNYGAFLQAYALQQTLRALGAEPRFILPRSGLMPARSAYGAAWRRLRLYLGAFFRPRMAAHYYKRNRLLEEAVSRNLATAHDTARDGLAVIGSDELWNIKNSRIGYVPEFYSNGLSGKICSYAVSCGQSLVASDYPVEALKGMRRIDRPSVRDLTTQRLFMSLSNRDCPVVLDPVFLHDFSDEAGRFELPRYDYLLVYGRIPERAYISAIKRFAKQKSLKTVSAGIYNGWCRKNIAAGPFEFLKLLEGAAYVVTDTFHGAAFSIIYKKNFASIVRSEKASDLLSAFGLEERRLQAPEELDAVFSRSVDISKTESILKAQRALSIDFIKDFIKRD